jgi:hypothetical protein
VVNPTQQIYPSSTSNYSSRSRQLSIHYPPHSDRLSKCKTLITCHHLYHILGSRETCGLSNFSLHYPRRYLLHPTFLSRICISILTSIEIGSTFVLRSASPLQCSIAENARSGSIPTKPLKSRPQTHVSRSVSLPRMVSSFASR